MDMEAAWVFYPRIYRFCRARVDWNDAEDLTTAVYEKVAANWHRFQPPARDPMAGLWQWLITITKNAIIDHYRQRRDLTLIDPAEEVDRRYYLTAHIAEPEEVWEAKLLQARIIEAMRCLNRQQQEVIACRFIAGLSLLETGMLLGMNVASVKSMQWRALENLRGYLETDYTKKAQGGGSHRRTQPGEGPAGTDQGTG